MLGFLQEGGLIVTSAVFSRDRVKEMLETQPCLPSDQKENMNDLLALNICLEELIKSATDDLNFAVEEYLNRAALVRIDPNSKTPASNDPNSKDPDNNDSNSKNSNGLSSSKALETTIDNLKLPTTNSTNLLLHLLHDDLYIPIAKKHGITATGAVISIQDSYCKFEFTELCQVTENYQQIGGRFVIPPPQHPMSPLTVLEKVTQHMQRADERINSLGATINRLEDEIKFRLLSERSREEALQLHLEKDKQDSKIVVIVHANRAVDASHLLIHGAPHDLEEYLN